MSKHTPGPWSVVDLDTYAVEIHSNDACDYHIADIVPGDPETMLANARLIAKAPEMYKELKYISRALEDWDATCTDRSYTDTGKNWDILNELRERVDNLLAELRRDS